MQNTNIIIPSNRYAYNRLEVVQGGCCGQWRIGCILRDYGFASPYLYPTREGAILALIDALQAVQASEPTAGDLLQQLKGANSPRQLPLFNFLTDSAPIE